MQIQTDIQMSGGGRGDTTSLGLASSPPHHQALTLEFLQSVEPLILLLNKALFPDVWAAIRGGSKQTGLLEELDAPPPPEA